MKIHKIDALKDVSHRVQTLWYEPKPFIYPIKRFSEYAHNQEFGNCFFMSLLNLVTPKWENVDCNKPLSADVFCQLVENKVPHKTSIQIQPDSRSCLKGYIKHNNLCYLFEWHTSGTNKLEKCLSKRLNSFNIQQFQFLFDAVTDIFPPVYSADLKYIITYKRYWNTYSYKLNSDYTEKEGMYICAEYPSEYFHGNHVFKCSSGVFYFI